MRSRAGSSTQTAPAGGAASATNTTATSVAARSVEMPMIVPPGAAPRDDPALSPAWGQPRAGAVGRCVSRLTPRRGSSFPDRRGDAQVVLAEDPAHVPVRVAAREQRL